MKSKSIVMIVIEINNIMVVDKLVITLLDVTKIMHFVIEFVTL